MADAQKWDIQLPAELAQFVSEQLATGAWGSPDVLFAYALAVVRAQVERARQDGSEQLLQQVRNQIAETSASHDEAENLLGGMFGAVPLTHEEEKAPDINAFLKQLQEHIAAGMRKPG